ncbi:hypothetical protein ACFCYB_13075 [Streptomyces sp. NPDC056309]|uniref:hypothetical protein n=1 Tax=unclassified Streptomyces TaxID=2593676 RepID=UPI0035DC60CA
MKENENCFTSEKVGAEKYYFFPQKTGDIVVSILGNLSCVPGATVRMVAFVPHRDAVAQKVRSLADQGCSIRIVHNDRNYVDRLSGHSNTALRQ